MNGRSIFDRNVAVVIGTGRRGRGASREEGLGVEEAADVMEPMADCVACWIGDVDIIYPVGRYKSLIRSELRSHFALIRGN